MNDFHLKHRTISFINTIVGRQIVWPIKNEKAFNVKINKDLVVDRPYLITKPTEAPNPDFDVFGTLVKQANHKKFSFIPFTKCNYKCAHCFENGANDRHDELKNIENSFLERCQTLNTVAKHILHAASATQCEITFMGGEATIVDKELLLQGLLTCSKDINVNVFSIISNGSASYEYYNYVLSNLKKTLSYLPENQVAVALSFHDSQVKRGLPTQRFLSKVLRIGIIHSTTSFGCVSTMTISRDNQNLLVGAYAHNHQYNNSAYTFDPRPLLDFDSRYMFDNGVSPINMEGNNSIYEFLSSTSKLCNSLNNVNIQLTSPTTYNINPSCATSYNLVVKTKKATYPIAMQGGLSDEDLGKLEDYIRGSRFARCDLPSNASCIICGECTILPIDYIKDLDFAEVSKPDV